MILWLHIKPDVFWKENTPQALGGKLKVIPVAQTFHGGEVVGCCVTQMQEGGEMIEVLRTCVDVCDSDILGGMEDVQSLQS